MLTPTADGLCPVDLSQPFVSDNYIPPPLFQRYLDTYQERRAAAVVAAEARAAETAAMHEDSWHQIFKAAIRKSLVAKDVDLRALVKYTRGFGIMSGVKSFCKNLEEGFVWEKESDEVIR
ncbi:hypothetical protein Tco_1238173 [Tanacetum coccineum]